MKTALIPVAAKFLDDEFIYPYYRLQEAGFHVDVYCAAPIQGKYGLCCYGKYGVPAPVTLTNLYSQEDVDHQGCTDLLLVPGGVESTEVLRQDKALLKLINNMMERERLVAAYCHGPQVLISAGVTSGRHMTCYKGMMVDLKNAGAIVPDESVRVVTDGNLVTSQHYRDNPKFLPAVLSQYKLLNEVIH